MLVDGMVDGFVARVLAADHDHKHSEEDQQDATSDKRYHAEDSEYLDGAGGDAVGIFGGGYLDIHGADPGCLQGGVDRGYEGVAVGGHNYG